MNAIEVLAAARGNPGGPYVPAREEWLRGWQGPVAPIEGTEAIIIGPDLRPARLRHGPWLCSSSDGDWPGGYGARSCRIGEIQLDTRRPEVRDHLVRHGCPAWARDVPAAVWAWAGGVEIVKLFPPWKQRGGRSKDWERIGAKDGRYLHVDAGGHLSGTTYDTDRTWIPWWRWNLSRFDGHFVTVAEGRESTPDEAKVCADLAALRAGCVLEEPDGWYVPLAGGGVGWWPR